MSGDEKEIEIRRALREDVSAIVAMLADDPLGSQRENFSNPLPASYYGAFEVIDADPRQYLMVATLDGAVVGTLQLTILPYLTYRGGSRALIEAVRVARAFRGHGIGERLFRWAIERARSEGCHMVQLTTDKKRPDALRFYEKLGFVTSHEGCKLHLGADLPSGPVEE